MELEASPAPGHVDGTRPTSGAGHNSVPAAEGEATAGGNVPGRCSSPALQLALSAGSSRADGAASASLHLPFLASALHETPTLGGAARELSPLADVPDALSLGLSAGSAGVAAPAGAVPVDHPSTACAGRCEEGAQVVSCVKGRAVAGERPDEYIEAPQLQTQLRAGEDKADLDMRASEGAPQASAVADVAPSQNPADTAPLLESGPVLHTQLAAAHATAPASEAANGAPAPAANTQAEAAASANPAGSLRLVPDSQDPSSDWQHRHAAQADGPANRQLRSPGARVASAADVQSSANGETGGRSTGAGSSTAPAAICAMDAPLDSAPVMNTQHGAASEPACAEAAAPASTAGVPDGREQDGSEVAVTPAVERSTLVPAPVAHALQEPVGSADQPSRQHTASAHGPIAVAAGKDDRAAPADPSGLSGAESAPKPDSIGDKTTEVTTSPDKLPRSSSAHDDEEATVPPHPRKDIPAEHAGDVLKCAADIAELPQPPAQRSAAMAQAVRDGDLGGRPCISEVDAAGSAAVADDAADASIAAPVPDSQPAEGGAADSLGFPSLPRQVRLFLCMCSINQLQGCSTYPCFQNLAVHA